MAYYECSGGEKEFEMTVDVQYQLRDRNYNYGVWLYGKNTLKTTIQYTKASGVQVISNTGTSMIGKGSSDDDSSSIGRLRVEILSVKISSFNWL